MAISTNLGALVLDFGRGPVGAFRNESDRDVADEREMNTFAGTAKIGMASGKLLTSGGKNLARQRSPQFRIDRNRRWMARCRLVYSGPSTSAIRNATVFE